MARAGMSNLIAELRSLAQVGTSDHTLNSITFWSDDQLQEMLDRYRQTWKRVLLESAEDYIDGDYSYTEYVIPSRLKWFEESAASSGWALRDSAGAAVVASHTINYESGIITFAADTRDADYYLDARTYDLYSAAADVWRRKASFVASATDWKSDNHDIKASQEYKHCLAMAEHFEGMAGAGAGGGLTDLHRSDMAPGVTTW